MSREVCAGLWLWIRLRATNASFFVTLSVMFLMQFSPTSMYLQSSFSRAIVGPPMHFPTLHVGDGYRILCGAGDMSYALASTLQDG